MNTILLCEGKTDAILIGYYIDKLCRFAHTNEKVNREITIAINKSNEFFEWHKRGDDYLAIWGVGGKNCFESAIERFQNVLVKSSDTLTYHQFIIVCDRDLEKDNKTIISEYSKCFTQSHIPLANNYLQKAEYINSFGQSRFINTFALIIPQDKLGALETALLDSIREDDYDKNIVEKSEQFVMDTRLVAGKYISSERLELKAKLSAVFAIMSPEKVFSFIDDLLKTTIKWEEKQYLNDLFQELVKVFDHGELQ